MKKTKDNMDLDHLKKSWNTLDEQLQKQDVVDEKQIEELIEKYQSGVKKGLAKLSELQIISLAIGVVCAIILIIVLVVATKFFTSLSFSVKEIVMTGYIVLSCVGGFLWDWQTYRFSRNIKVDEMPIVEVIRCVYKYKKIIKYELVAVCLWTLIFTSLYYWVNDYYSKPLTVQIAFLLGSLILFGTAMYFLYTKVLYKRLNDIEENLNKLKIEN